MGKSEKRLFDKDDLVIVKRSIPQGVYPIGEYDLTNQWWTYKYTDTDNRTVTIYENELVKRHTWVQYYDKSGKPYYHLHGTTVSQYNRPPTFHRLNLVAP